MERGRWVNRGWMVVPKWLPRWTLPVLGQSRSSILVIHQFAVSIFGFQSVLGQGERFRWGPCSHHFQQLRMPSKEEDAFQ
jgi:hypothetical protein